MKQLGVVVSPSAILCNPRLTLICLTCDLDPCDLWLLQLWPLTFRSYVKYTMQILEKHVFHLELWPTSLTFDLEQCDLWPYPFFSRIKNYAKYPKTHISIWWPWPLTYDLDIKGRISSRYITILNFMALGAIPPEIWSIIQWILVQSQLDWQHRIVHHHGQSW